MHTAVLYIHGFLASASVSGARAGRQRCFLKVKSIMHEDEGPWAKPKSLKP
jgi:hypothetical protein